MKKHLFLTSLVAIVATTGAVRADEITIDSIKTSLSSSAITTPAPSPSQTVYNYALPDGQIADLTAGTTADTYADYVATSAASANENVALADGSAVKLGETMSAADYTYSSKDAEGNATMVAGTTAVAELNKVYESAYGNIAVSTDADPVVNIANYKETGDGDVVYSLHDNGDGTFAIYNNGVDVTEAFPGKLATLQNAYKTDVKAVADLKAELDGYKAYNVANHDAIADIAADDNATIAGIAANKAIWETVSAKYEDDTTAYNTAVANYNDSLGKVVDGKIASGSVEAVVANAQISEVTEPAPDASTYKYTLANGKQSDMSNAMTPDYDGYVATSAAAGNANVALADGSAVKLGETMSAADYTYSSKDAEGNATMVAGTTAVAELNKVYESAYGNIAVSTDADPVVNIANYVNGEYSLHEEADGSIVLYQNGALELDSPEMFATLKGAYDADVKGVADLKAELDGYKAYNVANHDAIADIAADDNATIAGIAANKAIWETVSAKYEDDTTAYNTAVANYNNSLSKVVNDKVATETTRATEQEAAIRGEFAAADAQLSEAIAALNGGGSGSVKYAVEQEAERVDGIMGTIHGLISEESSENRKTTNGKDYKGNLAIGTTVEDHLLALDSAIGDRDTLNGNHVAAGESVVANLQLLNNGLEQEITDRIAGDELTLSTAKDYTDTVATGLRNEFAAADALTLNKANAYTDSKVKSLEKNMSGGVAAATALSAVSVANVNRGEVSVGGGYGYFNGQSAMAFGAAMGLSDSWSINAGAGIASGDSTQFSIRAGTNYKFKLF